MGRIYTKYKIFHYKEKIDSLPESADKILAPVHIRIKPTNVCNHNCHYCAYRAKNLQLGKDMRLKETIPEAKMMEIIDDLAYMGVEAITFSGGGEPFCYPHLLAAVTKLSQTPIQFAALTNGSILTQDVAEVFAHHGTWLRVSMDGWDDDSYTHYRKVSKKEYSNILRNMEAFKKIGGKCYLGVSVIVDQHNAGHVYGMIKRLKETGADSVKISPCIVSNDGLKNNTYHRPIFVSVKENVTAAVEDFKDDSFEIYDAYHELDEKFEKQYTWCPYLQILPVIGADLNIYACQDKAYNLDQGRIGSLKNRRFKNIWFSDKRRFFGIDPSRHCNHHCVANQKNAMLIEYLLADDAHKMFV